MKNLIKKATLLLVASLMITTNSTVYASTKSLAMVNTSAAGTLNLTGSSVISVAPDVASVSFSVSNRNANMATAINETNATIETIKSTLVKSNLNISLDNITTSWFNTYPEYSRQERDYNKQATIIGYVVSHQMSVSVDNIENLNDVINILVDSGAENLNNVNYSLKNKEEAYNKALELAIANAVSKANTLTKLLNLQNVRLTNINESNNNYYPDTFAMESKAMSDGMGISDVNVLPKNIEIRGFVNTTFTYN